MSVIKVLVVDQHTNFCDDETGKLSSPSLFVGEGSLRYFSADNLPFLHREKQKPLMDAPPISYHESCHKLKHLSTSFQWQ